MFLKELYIKNFMLFKEVNITFPENNKVIGIIGKYETEEGRSNRAGKSTLIDAITYLLYGISRVGSRGHKKLVNRSSQKNKEGFTLRGTWILDDGRELVIERSRDYQGKNPVVLVSGYEGAGIEEANQVIERLIGFSYDEYSNTADFKQGDINRFMMSSPTEKRNLLLDWLNQSRWDKRFKYTKDLQKSVSVEIEAVDIALQSLSEDYNIEELESELSDLKIKIEQCEIEIKNKTKESEKLLLNIQHEENEIYLETEIKKYDNDLIGLRDKLIKAKEYQEDRVLLEERYERYENNKAKKLGEVDKKGSLLERKREAQEVALRKKNEEAKEEAIEELQEEVEECRREWDTVVNELTLSENISLNLYNNAKSQLEKTGKYAGVCPVLKEECDRIRPDDTLEESVFRAKQNLNLVREDLDKALASKKAELSDLDNQILFTKENLKKDYVTNLEKIAEWYGAEVLKIEKVRKEIIIEYAEKMNKCKRELSEIPNESVDFYQEKVDNTEVLISDLICKQSKIRYDLTLTKTDYNVYIGVIDNLKKENIQFKSDLSLVDYKYNQAKDSEEKRHKLQLKYDNLKSKYSELEYCKFMFGSRGIPQEFIKESFEKLEEDINYLLEQMNTNLEIEFKPYKVGSTFEKNCLVCGYEFSGRQRKCPECGETRQKKRSDSIVLNVIDKFENNISTFEQDSGGGQTLISFAVRLALLFLKIREGNCQVPGVVLDEVAGMLDPVNRAAIMSVVLRILTEEYNVPQVFWISHEDDIKESLNSNLIVTRCSDYSEIEWG